MSRGLVVALAVVVAIGARQPTAIVLEVRTFDGTNEVTAQTRITVHRGGERGDPVGQTDGRAGGLELSVAPGIYDVQAIRERDGRVLNIRWAERLVVMPYPDEDGRHLEVINFTTGFGALQVRERGTTSPEAAIYAPGDRVNPAAGPAEGSDYVLFVVPAGKYDVQTRTRGRMAWHRDIEVPLDRTRLWFIP